jgi:hypothetical protein
MLAMPPRIESTHAQGVTIHVALISSRCRMPLLLSPPRSARVLSKLTVLLQHRCSRSDRVLCHSFHSCGPPVTRSPWAGRRPRQKRCWRLPARTTTSRALIKRSTGNAIEASMRGKNMTSYEDLERAKGHKSHFHNVPHILTSFSRYWGEEVLALDDSANRARAGLPIRNMKRSIEYFS